MPSVKTLAFSVRTGSRSAQAAREIGPRLVGRVSLGIHAGARSRRRGTCVTPCQRWNMLDAKILSWVTQSGVDPQLLMRLTQLHLIAFVPVILGSLMLITYVPSVSLGLRDLMYAR